VVEEINYITIKEINNVLEMFSITNFTETKMRTITRHVGRVFTSDNNAHQQSDRVK
jgi:hypothetical protein